MPEQTAKKILKNNSKTFYLASLFLPDAVKKNVYTVYAYCRLYDDNVDLNKSDSTQELENKLISLGIEQRVIDQLKSGINSDKEFTRIESISELLRYSYRVAGCVGIMMCDVLDIKNPNAKYHAIDLGIAMQLTNICRDIKEDFSIDRIYLPRDIISDEDFKLNNKSKVFSCVKDIIKLADEYYESALKGIPFIPLNSRFSILYALKLYQSIGHKILTNKETSIDRKINTTKFDKLIIFLKTSVLFIFQYLLPASAEHNNRLHKSLTGLPYIDERV